MNGSGVDNMQAADADEEVTADSLAHTVNNSDLTRIWKLIEATEENGQEIRSLIRAPNEEPFGLQWEVDVAMSVLSPLSQRWNIEICSALYIGGPARFNNLKGLLSGISSRTLSDKLSSLSGEGYITRTVEEGPPVKTLYSLTEKGMRVGRLLGNLVAYLKMDEGYVVTTTEE